jgi:hypothetical protein
MDVEEILPNQTVLVEGDRIILVGPAEEVEVPPESIRIDSSGLYLLPGLADMHAHIGEDYGLTLFLANGVTTIRNMEGFFFTPRWREEVESGARFGPTIITAGPILDDSTMTREEAIEEVRREVDAGFDFIKVYNHLSAEAYEGVVEAAGELGVPLAGHVPFRVGLHRALEVQRSIEHLRGYIWEFVPESAPVQPDHSTYARWMAWEYADTTRFRALAQLTATAGVWNCPNLLDQTFFGSPEAQHLARLAAPETRFLPAFVVAARRDRARDPYFGSFTEEDFQRLHLSAVPVKQKFVRALRDAGAGLLLGSDSWVVTGFGTHEELAELVKAGLTPYEALRAGTFDAARYLEQESEFGAVREGMRADLVLVDGNPLEDVANLENRLGVMARGRWYPQEDLQLRLEALAIAQEARGLALEGRVLEALEKVAGADGVFPSGGTPASALAEVCGAGVEARLASEVLPFCDRALQIEAGEALSWRDNRGKARAMTGDFEGSIEDFEFFVEWVREIQPEAASIRAEWIEALRRGENPFSEEPGMNVSPPGSGG